MANIRVRDAQIVFCNTFWGADGVHWKKVEILWDNPEFMPGQFLMAARKIKDFPWPSPLMIQKKTEKGFLVYIHKNSPLWEISRQEVLTVWGPCGTGMELTKDYILVSDGAGSLLIEPFAAASGRCKARYKIGEEGRDLALLQEKEIRMVQSMEEIWEQEMEEAADVKWIAAIPFVLVRKWKEKAPESIRRRTWVAAGVKIGCGIGACRGCYIHGENRRQGVPVCQEGPFLPIDSLDDEKDQKFLAHYI